MADTFLHRSYHSNTDSFVYWTASGWDPTGASYTSPSPPFNELSHTVVVNVVQDLGAGLTIHDESLSDQADGNNDTFLLDFEPAVEVLYVYVNGLLQEKGKHYEIVTQTIVFESGCIPRATDNVLAIYYTGDATEATGGDPRVNAPTSTIGDSTALISPRVHDARGPRKSDVLAPSETIGDNTALIAPSNNSPNADGFSESTVSTGGSWTTV